MQMGLSITAWATVEHYIGLSTDNPYEASFNKLNKWCTMFTGNLGYHTAHNHYEGLHWSKLPKLHARPADKIPNRLIRDIGLTLLVPSHRTYNRLRRQLEFDPVGL